MEGKVLFEITHIRLLEELGGNLCLEVGDMELWDFVQDYLWDNFEITETEVEFPNVDEGGNYKSYYTSDVKADDLIIALSQLDVQEVERIYKLNN